MKLLRLIPDGTKIPFMSWRRVTFPLALILVVSSLAGWAVFGFNYGIDFVGGTVIEVRSKTGPADTHAIRQKIEALHIGEVQIQSFGGPEDALVRIGYQEGGEQAQQAAIGKVRDVLGDAYEFRRTEVVGPAVSADLRRDAAIAVVLSLLLILAYLWFRFEWQFAVGAILTTIHDVALTLGFMAWTHISFDLPILAAVLTIVGYSLNDTVVIYDRVREMLRKYKKMPVDELIDLSINQTLSRTIVTAITVFIAALSLLIFGGDALRGFNMIMVFGIVIGTYSSIIVSAPLLIFLHLRPGDADGDKKPSKAKKPGADVAKPATP
jgi:preprotein translocase SecF subunit